jgi:hypothetical protein
MILILSPAILFSQTKNDTDAVHYEKPPYHTHQYQDDSTFSILLNTSTVIYTARDTRINNWLTKYGYRPPQRIPTGVNIELAAIPFNSKMMFGINGGTVVSRQDIISSNFTIGIYRRFVERRKFWILAGAGIGRHGDRVVLNGQVPPEFDSLANQYNKILSLHRTGFLIEPAARLFWYPIQTRKLQLGLFANTAYDFSFNTRWKLGYYNQNGQFTSFKRIRKPTDVQTEQEFGFAFSGGLSFCFKFN